MEAFQLLLDMLWMLIMKENQLISSLIFFIFLNLPNAGPPVATDDTGRPVTSENR